MRENKLAAVLGLQGRVGVSAGTRRRTADWNRRSCRFGRGESCCEKMEIGCCPPPCVRIQRGRRKAVVRLREEFSGCSCREWRVFRPQGVRGLGVFVSAGGRRKGVSAMDGRGKGEVSAMGSADLQLSAGVESKPFGCSCVVPLSVALAERVLERKEG